MSAGKAVTRVVHRCDDCKENQKLDLSECLLKSMPDAVFHLLRNTTVLSCNLSRNCVTRIPPKLPMYFNFLLDLDISHNNLTSLPNEIGRLRDLRSLNITQNKFCEMPEAVYQCAKLKELIAENNEISDVDVDKLKQIRPLRKINLVANPISATSREKLKLMSKNISVELSLYRESDEYKFGGVD